MTDGRSDGTNGGWGVASGMSPRATLWTGLAVLAAALSVQTFANVYSILADRRHAGIDVTGAEVWTAELSSVLAWLSMMPLIWWAVGALRPPRLGWPRTIVVHLAMSVAVSLAHIAIMVGVRKLTWWVAGSHYDFANDYGDALLGEVVYEYRKDLATYVEIAIGFALIQWLVARSAERARPREREMILVPDGARIHHIPIDEIDHAQAAGNYVELRWRQRTILHRATLAALEQRLAAHGFVRIHRSRLVRRSAIRGIVTGQSGDFEAMLESGEVLKGSRRFRGDL